MALDDIANNPVDIPKTTELVTFLENIYKGEMGTSEVPKKSPERAIFVAVAQLAILLFRKISWIYRQIFVTTANDETIYRKGQEKGIVKEEGVNEIITATLSGAEFASLDQRYEIDDFVYEITELVDSTSVKLTSLDNGTDYNRTVGDTLNAVQTVVNVGSSLVVTAIDQVSTDDETSDEYNEKVIINERANPQGGNAYSYLIWSIEVNDVVDAYVYVDDAGVITVMPIGSGSNGDRICDLDKRNEVSDSIDRSEDSSYDNRRALNDNVIIEPGTNVSVDITINNFASEDEDLKTLIEESLTNYLNALRSVNTPTGKSTSNSYVNKTDVESIVNTLTKDSTDDFTVSVDVSIEGTIVVSQYPVAQYTIVGLGTISYE